MNLLDLITGKPTSEDVERTERDDDAPEKGMAGKGGSGGRSRGRTAVLFAVVIAGLLAWRRRRS